MTRDPLTVPLESPFTDARRMMVERRIRHLLVTDGRTAMAETETVGAK